MQSKKSYNKKNIPCKVQYLVSAVTDPALEGILEQSIRESAFSRALSKINRSDLFGFHRDESSLSTAVSNISLVNKHNETIVVGGFATKNNC